MNPRNMDNIKFRNYFRNLKFYHDQNISKAVHSIHTPNIQSKYSQIYDVEDERYFEVANIGVIIVGETKENSLRERDDGLVKDAVR